MRLVQVRVMELQEPYAVLRGFLGLKSQDHSVRAAISPDGQYVVSGSDDGRLCVWDSSGDSLVPHANQLPLSDCCT